VGSEPLAPAAGNPNLRSQHGIPSGLPSRRHPSSLVGPLRSERGEEKLRRTRAWTITRPGPVILTTKEDWPVELSPVVNALASWRDKDFVGVRFNSKSPHFTATVALENLSDQKAAAALLGLFRELAASSSAKQH
jgi:hypothetical protein